MASQRERVIKFGKLERDQVNKGLLSRRVSL